MNMLLIKKNGEKNYLFFRKKDDEYSLSGFKLIGNKQCDLDIDVVNEFSVFKLGNNVKNLGIEEGYNIVLDLDTGFKHYVKDGQFDYHRFYLKNGEDATLYSGGDNGGKNKLKRFVVNGTEFLIDSFLEKLIPLVLVTGMMFEVSTCLKAPEITVQGVCDYISSSSKLTEDEKNFLINETLIEDVVRYASGTSATVMLKNRLDGMEIVNFSDEIF